MQYLPPGLLQACAVEIGFLEHFLKDSQYLKARKRLEPFLRVKADLITGMNNNCYDTDMTNRSS